MYYILPEQVRINEPEIQEWLNKKKNKSKTHRQALRLLYQKELQDNFKKQDKKPELIPIA